MAKRTAASRPRRTPSKSALPARGPLRSMRVSAAFRDFVLDQLAGVRELRARAMFGGVGLYAGDAFFGILAADALYLKVDDSNRAFYVRAGSAPFKPYADRPMTMSYYDVPARILEDASTLAEWAERSITIARVTRTSRSKR